MRSSQAAGRRASLTFRYHLPWSTAADPPAISGMVNKDVHHGIPPVLIVLKPRVRGVVP